MNVTGHFKTGIFFNIIAGIFIVLSFSFANWGLDSESSYKLGLWRVCTNGICSSMAKSDNPAWFIVIQVLACLALWEWVCILLLAGLFICIPSRRNNPRSIYWLIISALSGVIELVICTALFASRRNSLLDTPLSLDWAFYLSVVSAAFYVVVSILFILYLRDQRKSVYDTTE